jgi:hypothetical protein
MIYLFSPSPFRRIQRPELPRAAGFAVDFKHQAPERNNTRKDVRKKAVFGRYRFFFLSDV